MLCNTLTYWAPFINNEKIKFIKMAGFRNVNFGTSLGILIGADFLANIRQRLEKLARDKQYSLYCPGINCDCEMFFITLDLGLLGGVSLKLTSKQVFP
jgi:hypothetical protein